MTFHMPESLRIRTGPMASTTYDGCNGAFEVRGPRNTTLWVIASDGPGNGRIPWEHVSVSTRKRPPYWDEMCHVKDLFWGPEDVVVQYHPRKSEYVNCHPNTLHMWRPVGVTLPTPDPEMVGPKR